MTLFTHHLYTMTPFIGLHQNFATIYISWKTTIMGLAGNET